MKHIRTGKSHYQGIPPHHWRWVTVAGMAILFPVVLMILHIEFQSEPTGRAPTSQFYHGARCNGAFGPDLLPCVSNISSCGAARLKRLDASGAISRQYQHRQIGGYGTESGQWKQPPAFPPGDAGLSQLLHNSAFAEPLYPATHGSRLTSSGNDSFCADISGRPSVRAYLSLDALPLPVKNDKNAVSHATGTAFSPAPAESQQPGRSRIPVANRRERIYQPIVVRAAAQHQVDPALVMAIIFAESGYNPKAVSKSGAVGLMQLMPTTARAMGVRDSYDPEHNIYGGVKYLKMLVNKYGGNVMLALAAYNAGSRKVWEYRGVPPYKSTRHYIQKVLRYYRRYQGFLAQGVERI